MQKKKNKTENKFKETKNYYKKKIRQNKTNWRKENGIFNRFRSTSFLYLYFLLVDRLFANFLFLIRFYSFNDVFLHNMLLIVGMSMVFYSIHQIHQAVESNRVVHVVVSILVPILPIMDKYDTALGSRHCTIHP